MPPRPSFRRKPESIGAERTGSEHTRPPGRPRVLCVLLDVQGFRARPSPLMPKGELKGFRHAVSLYNLPRLSSAPSSPTHTLTKSLPLIPTLMPYVAHTTLAGLRIAPSRWHPPCKIKCRQRSVAQLARALVSKTKGRGFESCRSCQVLSFGRANCQLSGHAGMLKLVDRLR